MAKLNKVVEQEQEVEVTKDITVYVPGEDQEKPSLHQLALVLGIPAVRLQSAQVAYKPVEGLPYDSKRINWANVSAFISRRLDKTDYDTVEEVYEAALKTEYTPKRGSGRAASEGSVYGKFIFGTTPLRKGNVKVGDTIYRKKDNMPFKVLFVNETIVVYAPEGENVVSEAIGNRMFNMNFVFEPIGKGSETETEAAE